MTNTEGRIHSYINSSVREIFTEGNIFGAGITNPINLYERVAKVWILQLFDDTFSTREESHTIVCNGNVLILLLRFSNLHKTERPISLEVFSVPLLYTRIMFQIFHSIETGYNWVLLRIFDEFNDLIRCKSNIRINRDPHIIVEFTTKWFLVGTSKNI